MATNPFKDVIDVDIRQSTPDWEPYKQPKAPVGVAHTKSKIWLTYHA